LTNKLHRENVIYQAMITITARDRQLSFNSALALVFGFWSWYHCGSEVHGGHKNKPI